MKQLPSLTRGAESGDSAHVSPLQAAAIMLPILCVMDVINVWVYRAGWDRRNIKILLLRVSSASRSAR